MHTACRYAGLGHEWAGNPGGERGPGARWERQSWWGTVARETWFRGVVNAAQRRVDGARRRDWTGAILAWWWEARGIGVHSGC